MRGIVKAAAVAVLVVATATACTRRVQVESEPNRSQATAATIDIAGTYDFVVDLPPQQGDATGVLSVNRTGDAYMVSMTSNMGAVTTRNVRRVGNTLTMDANTHAGEGAIELTWQSRERVNGIVFLGEAYNLTATRRP